jgi:hypothetical protein
MPTTDVEQENIAAVRRGFAAFQAQDMGALTELFREDATWGAEETGVIGGNKTGRNEIFVAICSVVSMALTVSYLRLVVGLRFAAVEAALAQFFYLILFSYALFDEGYSGLSITIGAIVTLFVTMQVTGRVDWFERFGGKRTTPAQGAAYSSPS